MVENPANESIRQASSIDVQPVEERPMPLYANGVFITSSDRDFVVSFAQAVPVLTLDNQHVPSARLHFVAQIVMNEKTVRELRQALDTQIDKFQQRLAEAGEKVHGA